MKHLGFKHTVAAWGHMERRAMKRDKCLLSKERLRLFEEAILVIDFRQIQPLIHMGRFTILRIRIFKVKGSENS